MILSQHRFHGRKGLIGVYKRGLSTRNQFMSLKYVRTTRPGGYRLAIVVSRKVHKSAVKRNRVRRRIYEIIRHQEKNIKSPHDMVLTIFSEQVVALPQTELQNMVTKLLKQAGILQ